jgi:hypothetical protein
LLEAAKDRKIAGTVWAKLVYDKRTGKIRLSFRPDFEVIAKYNHEDEEMLDEVHFTHYLDSDSRVMWKQSFYLEWSERIGDYECTSCTKLFMRLTTITIFGSTKSGFRSHPMGINFIPIVEVPNERLTGMTRGYSEIDKISEITDEINRKLERLQ